MKMIVRLILFLTLTTLILPAADTNEVEEIKNVPVVGIFPTLPNSNTVYRGLITMTQVNKTNTVLYFIVTHSGSNLWSLKPCSTPYLISGTNLPFWGKPDNVVNDELLRKLCNPTE
jgi:hypothetical protein